MNPSTVKNIAGIIQLLVAVGINFVPPQYQAILTAIIGALAGVHAVTAGSVTDPKK